MGARAAKLFRPFIHHIEEPVKRASPDELPDLGGDIICGFQHHAVKHVFKLKFLSHLRIQIGAAVHRIGNPGRSHGGHRLRIAVFQCHQTGHDLCQRRGRRLRVHSLFREYSARIRIHDAVIIADGFFSGRRPGSILRFLICRGSGRRQQNQREDTHKAQEAAAEPRRGPGSTEDPCMGPGATEDPRRGPGSTEDPCMGPGSTV